MKVTDINVPPGIEVHQLLCGREIANDGSNMMHRYAHQMANYVYVVQDVAAKTCVVVDPAWDVDGIFKYCDEIGTRISGAAFTHRHFDHCGGNIPASMTGGLGEVTLPGIKEFVAKNVPVFVGLQDASAVAKQSGIPIQRITAVKEGDSIPVNSNIDIHVLSTPGHTPGSVCYSLAGVLFTGDTLFIGSCGRVDLPESDVQAMLESLDKLSKIDSETIVFPGHNYSRPAHSTIAKEKTTNHMMNQAMQRRGISPHPVAAMLPLPDYLGVARATFNNFSVANVKVDQLESHF
mmetsp:Transcript_18041/g.29265  ORF Transcript_18041/g.29265 Transcript_18041/m.29265 type:complete len:291 (+) Transcript_18041:60-932(+)